MAQFTNKDPFSNLFPANPIAKKSETPAKERKETDLFFTPTTEVPTTPDTLGLLGRMAQKPCVFEAFSKSPTPHQITKSLRKLFAVQTEFIKDKKAKNESYSNSELPQLWIITTIIKPHLLKEFGARSQPEWPSGVYFMAPAMHTGIIVVHELPKTPETLSLRVLGKGKVQAEAIAEINSLPENHYLRQNTAKSLAKLSVLSKVPEKDTPSIYLSE
jgi:hypothetical protein